MSRRYRLQGIVLAVGVLAAAGIAVLADRDTFAWSVPPLVLTLVLVAVITLADARPEEQRLEEAGRELGLRHQQARTLPPVTPLLAAVREPRVVQALEGELEPGGPPVRLAAVRAGQARLAICLTDLPGAAPAVADPHGLLAGSGVDAPGADHDGATAAWLADHPARLGYATGDEALVVFAAAPRDGAAPFAELLAAARQLLPRLSA